MKNKMILILVILAGVVVVALLTVGGIYYLWLPHAAQTAIEPDPALESFHRLEADTQNQPEFTFQNGFLRGAILEVEMPGDTTVERAHNFLAEYQDAYLQNDPALDLQVRRVDGDDDENVLLYQTYHGVEVFGSEILVVVYGDKIAATVGALLPAGVVLDTYPAVPAEQAVEIGRTFIDRQEAFVVGEVTLMVYDPSINEIVPPDPHLVWRVPLGPGATQIIYVDAHDGQVLMESSLAISGYDLDHEDANGYTEGYLDCYWNTTDDDFIGNESGLIADFLNNNEAVKSWWHSYNTYYFFKNEYGRDGFDNQGSELELYIYSGTPNGIWVGGTGCDLIEFHYGWVGWDGMVHEYSHGIQYYTSQLGMHGGTGQQFSLRESFADVQGLLADPNDWTVGEDRTGFNTPLRDLAAPSIKHIDNLNTSGTKSAAYQNSGIPSYAAYRTAAGGMDNFFIGVGLGTTAMGHLYYSVMKALPANAQFIDARNLAVTYATQRYTPEQVCVVKNAWAVVGVGVADVGCDGIPDPDLTDTDGDHVIDTLDNCVNTPNPYQKDHDYDGVGDICDLDDDNDYIPDTTDNCIYIKNSDQSDVDGDGKGDLCDDEDSDGVLDIYDNCVFDFNPNQIDTDGDGQGNACDLDLDGDGVPEQDRVGAPLDNCPFFANPDQLDSDGDGIGDACDDCPNDYDLQQAYTAVDPFLASMGVLPQPYQPDSDGDGIPDACDEGLRYTGPMRADGQQIVLDLRPRPGKYQLVPLPDCLPEGQHYFSEHYFGRIVLEGLDQNTGVWLGDSAGFGAAKTKTEGDQRVIEFTPRGGVNYFLLFGFKGDQEESEGDFLRVPLWMNCGEKEPVAEESSSPLVPIPSDPSTPPPVLACIPLDKISISFQPPPDDEQPPPDDQLPVCQGSDFNEPLDDNIPPPEDIMPVSYSRCSLFGEDMKLTMLDIPQGTNALTLFVTKPGGWPGLEFEVDGDDQHWEYSAMLGNVAADQCSYQGYQERLYCDFLLPDTYLDTYRTLMLFVNGCEPPIYQHDRVTIFSPEVPPTPGPTAACTSDLSERACIAAGGTITCDASGACSCACP